MADPWEQVHAYVVAATAPTTSGAVPAGAATPPSGGSTPPGAAPDAGQPPAPDATPGEPSPGDNDKPAGKTLGQRLSDRRVLAGIRGLNDKLIRPSSDKVRRLPTPGGIGLMLIALLVFLFAIIAVNGTHTRLELVWLTLLGKTSVPRAPGDADSGANARAALAAAGAGVSAVISTATGVPVPTGIASAGIGAALGVGGIKIIGG